MLLRTFTYHGCTIFIMCSIMHVTNGTTSRPSVYHGTCDGTRQKCSSGLNCIDGKCECRYPNHQIYDFVKCRSLVRGPCKTTSKNIYISSDSVIDACVLNAHCIEREDGYNECQCKTGYIESIEGKCELEFGSDCSSQITNCDKIPPLFCRNGICNCKDELEIYDKTFKKCKGGLGAFCKINDDCFGDDLECILNKIGRGQCNCKYSINNGICSPRPSNFECTNGWRYGSTPRWCSTSIPTQTTPYRFNTDKPTTRRSYNSFPETSTALIFPRNLTTTKYSYWSFVVPSYRTTQKPNLFYRTTTTRTGNINSFNPLPSEEEAEWITQ